MFRILTKVRSFYRLLGPRGCLRVSVAVAALAILIVSLGWYWRLQRREAEELARIERAGEPVTIADLETYYARPEGDEDLTAAWLAALAPLNSDTFDKAAKEIFIEPGCQYEAPPRCEPWLKIDAARELLEVYGTPLASFHELSRRRGDVRYELDFRHGSVLQLPHCESIRKGVDLLLFESEVGRREGDVARAVDALHTAYTLGRTLHREPVCLSQMYRIGCDGLVHAQLRRLLPELSFSESQFSLLRADLAAAHYACGLKYAMVGQRALGIAEFHDPSIVEESGETGGAGAMALMIVLSLGDLPDYLSWMDQLNQAAEFPPRQALQMARRVERELAELTGQESHWNPLRHFMLDWSLQTPILLFTSATRGEAHRICAETALAVAQFWQQTGKLPDSLDELVPNLLDTLPLDPFDGQPLRYAAASNGCRIYSVGVDGIDQGGREGDASEPLDIVFDIEFAPLAVGE
jgi:hypothetical protein